MIGRFIKNNIKYLNKYLVRGLLETQNIYISDMESNYLNYIIKRDYIKLLNKDYLDSFNYLEDKINKESLKEILNLYINLSNKYF